MFRNVSLLVLIVLLLMVLALPTAVFAQGGADDPAPTVEFEPTAEPVVAPVEVIDTGAGSDVTINVPAAVPAAEPAASQPSTVNYITLVGVIGLAVAFAIKTFQDRGGKINAETITATVETISSSEQFKDVLQTVASAIPKEVHDRALDQIDRANETIKQFTAVVAAITTAVDRITDKPTPPTQGS